MVIGPTPPGTGVMNPAFGKTASVHVADQPRCRGSGRLIDDDHRGPPHHRGVTKRGFPSRRSGCRPERETGYVGRGADDGDTAFASFPFCISRLATGFPTMLLRPITTA